MTKAMRDLLLKTVRSLNNDLRNGDEVPTKDALQTLLYVVEEILKTTPVRQEVG